MLTDDIIAMLEHDRQSYVTAGVPGAANAIGMLLREREELTRQLAAVTAERDVARRDLESVGAEYNLACRELGHLRAEVERLQQAWQHCGLAVSHTWARCPCAPEETPR